MRVLTVGTSDKRGGAASVGWDIGQELKKRGHQVNFLVAYKTTEEDYVQEFDKPILTALLDKYTRFNATSLYRNFRSFLLANDISFGVKEVLLQHPWYQKADLIQLHNLHGGFFQLENLIKISQEKPVVWTLHDMWAITGHSVYSNNSSVWRNGKNEKVKMMKYPPMLWNNNHYLWRKKKTIYKKSDLNIVTPSKWLRQKVKESILKTQDSYVINNGIDTTTFTPLNKKSARKELGLPLDKKIAIFVAQGGIYEERKGGKYLKQLIFKSQDENLLFLVIGGASKSSNISNLKFIPHINQKEKLNQYYNAADVFLFTSLAENFPLVVLEALSAGLPVVSFDVGGVKEIITHKKNGYIADLKRTKDLKKGLKYILGLSSEDLKNIKALNRKKAKKNYSVEKMSTNYLNLYQNLLKK